VAPSPPPGGDTRRGRNLALLVVLLGLAVLFFAITIAKLSHHT
jgi:hypothetical protein